ncbi:hypothetical protein CLU79DRAFT_435947 [Phycomyces nitens]|nr:hypothetical protein CLU79DRAFT_435947 [Phycomyces nitens]
MVNDQCRQSSNFFFCSALFFFSWCQKLTTHSTPYTQTHLYTRTHTHPPTHSYARWNCDCE